MKSGFRIQALLGAVAIAGLLGAQADGQQITGQSMQSDLKARELQAPAAVKTQLESLRQEIASKNWSFEVGYTAALDFPIEKITGLQAPADWLAKAVAHNQALVEAPPKTAPQEPLSLAQMAATLESPVSVCNAGAATFDWRLANGATPVRDQGACGSCWAFSTHGAFEGSYRIRRGVLDIDSSEQDTLDCNTSGYSCGGGWWAFQDIMDKGTSTEASYPYTAVKATCRNVRRPYHAVNWGFVDASQSIPSVAKIKAALCQYGPLSVAVHVSSAFQAYTGGVFNEHSAAGINHGVTLIGWDEPKKAWIIKNSWGKGWGETAGVGTDRGYMRIAYDSNSIGTAAAWTKSAPPQDCVSFNPVTATVAKIGLTWKIVDGNHWMFDFGTNVTEARRALRIIKFYRMNRSCFVGRPGPSFTYMLVNNTSPAGVFATEDCIAFNPALVRVQQVGGSWKIVQGNMWMYDFGPLKEEAYEALGIIKDYGFTRQCFVGRPGPSFQYLRR
jgi:C1A family cysteine protease